MLNRPDIVTAGFRVSASDPIPVGRLLLGKPVEEVAETLPRLFNLCRNAHSVAIRMALGLPVASGDDLSTEIRDEHLLRLAIILPSRLKLKPVPFTRGDPGSLTCALFGAGTFSRSPAAFEAFLKSGYGIAPVLHEIQARFLPGEACTKPLPAVDDASILSVTALENSIAARHRNHPVLQHIEAGHGRGPLWRITARAVDLQAVMQGDLPEPRLVEPGFAVVPVARGMSAIRARAEKGRLVDLVKVVPTDHLLAPGGILHQSIATLPATKHGQSQLLIDVLDACVPIRLEKTSHA